MATSGYTHCACRDCFETVVSDDMNHPDFCEECQEAGCDAHEEEDSEGNLVHEHECCREDAYLEEDDEPEDDAEYVSIHRYEREDFHSDG